MLLPSEDLKLGQDAFEYVKEYDLHKKARLWTWFGLFVWSFQTSLSFLFKPSYSNAILPFVWFVLAGFILRHQWKGERRYIRDLATLDELKKRYGSNISFERKEAANKADANANAVEKPIFTWRGFIAFGLLVSVILLYSHFVRPLLFPHH